MCSQIWHEARPFSLTADMERYTALLVNLTKIPCESPVRYKLVSYNFLGLILIELIYVKVPENNYTIMHLKLWNCYRYSFNIPHLCLFPFLDRMSKYQIFIEVCTYTWYLQIRSLLLYKKNYTTNLSEPRITIPMAHNMQKIVTMYRYIDYNTLSGLLMRFWF